MIGARNDRHPAESASAELLAVIAHAPTAVEARHHKIRAHELILDLQVEDTISRLDADNLRVIFTVAIEKRLYEIAGV